MFLEDSLFLILSILSFILLLFYNNAILLEVFNFSFLSFFFSIGHYIIFVLCRNKNLAVYNAGALPQLEMGSIKSGGAAATRSRQ